MQGHITGHTQQGATHVTEHITGQITGTHRPHRARRSLLLVRHVLAALAGPHQVERVVLKLHVQSIHDLRRWQVGAV